MLGLAGWGRLGVGWGGGALALAPWALSSTAMWVRATSRLSVSGERSRFLGAFFEGGAAEGGGACIASRIATSTDGGRSIPSHAAICVISANRNANRSDATYGRNGFVAYGRNVFVWENKPVYRLGALRVSAAAGACTERRRCVTKGGGDWSVTNELTKY